MSQTLHQLLQASYGIKTAIIESDPAFQVLATETKILSYNPNRVGLVFVNNGAANVSLRPSRPVTVGKGLLLLAAGGSIVFRWDQDFELVASEWYGIGNGGVSDFYVLEIVATS